MKVGRNDPCPCGTGQKYKKCCAAKDAAAESAELAARNAEVAARLAEAEAKAAEAEANGEAAEPAAKPKRPKLPTPHAALRTHNG
jgi:hypothetical protein